MSFQENIKWIVPPGLVPTLEQFKEHCDAAVQEMMPVLIYGDTGIGKSLFLRIYEDIYKRQFGQKIKIIRVNCSHFAGADPRIAQTELFGAVRGVASGINKNIDGMVFVANDGLLVLDEIGELPLEVQAMLLTYIETGEFRKLGSSETEKSNALIVAATNRPEELRRDFYQRFFPFQIPSLYKRRFDVLYYFASIYPELVHRLTTQQVLSLIAYNWPGNVREIKRMGLLLKRNIGKAVLSESKIEGQSEYKELSNYDYGWGVISFGSALSELEELSEEERNRPYSTIPPVSNLDQINDILEQHFVNTEPLRSVMKSPFNGFQEKALYLNSVDDSGIQILAEFEPFEKAYKGYKIFCALFLQNENQNSNALRLKRYTLETPFFTVTERRKLSKLTKDVGLSIVKDLAGLNDDDIDQRMREITFSDNRINLLKNLYERNPDNLFFLNLFGAKKDEELQTEKIDLSGYRLEDLLKSYYSQILRKTGGVEKVAAGLVGMPYTSFRDDLRRLGIKRKII